MMLDTELNFRQPVYGDRSDYNNSKSKSGQTINHIHQFTAKSEIVWFSCLVLYFFVGAHAQYGVPFSPSSTFSTFSELIPRHGM